MNKWFDIALETTSLYSNPCLGLHYKYKNLIGILIQC